MMLTWISHRHIICCARALRCDHPLRSLNLFSSYTLRLCSRVSQRRQLLNNPDEFPLAMGRVIIKDRDSCIFRLRNLRSLLRSSCYTFKTSARSTTSTTTTTADTAKTTHPAVTNSRPKTRLSGQTSVGRCESEKSWLRCRLLENSRRKRRTLKTV